MTVVNRDYQPRNYVETQSPLQNSPEVHAITKRLPVVVFSSNVFWNPMTYAGFVLRLLRYRHAGA